MVVAIRRLHSLRNCRRKQSRALRKKNSASLTFFRPSDWGFREESLLHLLMVRRSYCLRSSV